MDQLRIWLNDARVRSALAGGIGGFAGWFVAEVLLGRPAALWQTVLFGLLCGVGIAGVLGAAEGIVIGSRSLLQRGLAIGAALGALGGIIGATFGEVTYWVATGSEEGSQPDSFIAPNFSPEVQRRLDEAGAEAGEIEIALLWRNTNDLDLHVVDPFGVEIYYRDKQSGSGGWLDVDRNAGCMNTTREPVEHVRWAQGAVPDGEYVVYVNHYAHCGSADPTAYIVEIKNGNQFERFEGSITHEEPKKEIHRFARDSTAPAPAPAGGPGIFDILAVVIGWAIFGALVGCAEGVTRQSMIGLRNAVIGGTIGGAVGGLALVVVLALAGAPSTGEEEIARHSGWFARMLGLVILGACIGLWIVLIERALSAVLSVRSGRYEGREIYLDKEEVRFGRNETLEVFLGGDPKIAAHHATIRREGGAHTVLAAEGTVLVNGAAVTKHQLVNGDTVVLGDTRLIYKHKAAAPSGGQAGGAEQQRTVAAPRPSSTTPPKPPPPPPRKKKT
jgi:hypothetical protein